MSDDSIAGSTAVTATRHLAKVLREAHDARCVATGALSWPTLDAIPYDAWLRRLWVDAAAARVVPPLAPLGALQELALWERSVRSTFQAGTEWAGPDVYELARLARDTWRALHDAGHGAEALEGEHGTAARAFARCADDFATRCENAGWIDSAAIAPALARHGVADGPTLPDRVEMHGFDRLAPSGDALCDALRSAGVEVAHGGPLRVRSRRALVAVDSPEAELEIAARWARARLGANPSARVALLLPDLAGHRADVLRMLDEILTPGRAMAPDPAARAFNVSLGQPLDEYGLIADALVGLDLCLASVPMALMSRLLRSAYLRGEAEERLSRAALDARLRKLGETELTLAGLLRMARTGPEGDSVMPRTLLAGFADARSALGTAPGRQRLSQWAELFWGMLKTLGWPGDVALDSDGHQCVSVFGEVLSDLASLDAVLGPVAAGEAQARLRRACAERAFQPQSASLRIEVVSEAEAAGQVYSHLWVMGLHDGVWPPRPRPSPLLAVATQRRLGLALATHESCLEHARRVTDRLLESASEIVVSHARRSGDEPQRASPLVASLPSASLDELGLAPDPRYTSALHRARPALEVLADPRGPGWPGGKRLRGGVRVLADQAACPFRAFAVHRLEARVVEDVDSPLDSRLRGTLVHDVLERVWRELESRARLLALPAEARLELVRACIDDALGRAASARPGVRGRLRQLERARLERLVLAWLDRDAERPDFRVVAPEVGADVRIGALELHLRPDRLDRLDDGRYLVIDYKTGDASPGRWFGDRPDEPQLPIYTVWLPQLASGTVPRVAGAALAVLRADGVGLDGIGETDDLADGVRAVASCRLKALTPFGSWDEVIEQWGDNHMRLAAEFAAGDARVDPKDPSKNCRYCDVRPLCRIDEASSVSLGDVADSDEGARGP